MSSQNFEQQVIFYHNIFVYCAIAALIFLVIAVALFFLLKIPRVFGEMTGRDARKAIDEMMEENAKSGSLTSLKLGEDGRRRRRGRTGALATGRLRKNVSVRSETLGKSNASGGLGTSGVDGSQAAASAENGISGSYSQNAGTDLNAQTAFQSAPANEPDSRGNAQTEEMDAYGSTPTDVLDSFGSTPTDVLDSFVHVQQGTYAQETENMAGYAAPQGTPGAGHENAETYQAPSSETMVLSQNLRPDGDVFVILRSIVEIHTDEVV